VVTIRGAGSSDVDRIVEIIHGVPVPEALALAGTADLAREFGAGLVRLDGIPNKDKPTVVAVDGDCIVGVLQYRVGGHATPITLDHVKLALSVFGPVGLLKRLPRFRARSRVDLPTPANSFYIDELDVDPLRRGQGIGGQLLSWAVDEARRCGIVNMSLHTTTANPARRLYERHGFVVTQTAVDRRYEAYTGIAGRLLMERR